MFVRYEEHTEPPNDCSCSVDTYNTYSIYSVQIRFDLKSATPKRGSVSSPTYPVHTSSNLPTVPTIAYLPTDSTLICTRTVHFRMWIVTHLTKKARRNPTLARYSRLLTRAYLRPNSLDIGSCYHHHHHQALFFSSCSIRTFLTSLEWATGYVLYSHKTVSCKILNRSTD